MAAVCADHSVDAASAVDRPSDSGLLPVERVDSELDLLNEIAAAAFDFEKILSALIRTEQTDIVSTDIGAAALQDRLNRLNDANKALARFRSSRPE